MRKWGEIFKEHYAHSKVQVIFNHYKETEKNTIDHNYNGTGGVLRKIGNSTQETLSYFMVHLRSPEIE